MINIPNGSICEDVIDGKVYLTQDGTMIAKWDNGYDEHWNAHDRTYEQCKKDFYDNVERWNEE